MPTNETDALTNRGPWPQLARRDVEREHLVVDAASMRYALGALGKQQRARDLATVIQFVREEKLFEADMTNAWALVDRAERGDRAALRKLCDLVLWELGDPIRPGGEPRLAAWRLTGKKPPRSARPKHITPLEWFRGRRK